jgi:hypothetical protein
MNDDRLIRAAKSSDPMSITTKLVTFHFLRGGLLPPVFSVKSDQITTASITTEKMTSVVAT